MSFISKRAAALLMATAALFFVTSASDAQIPPASSVSPIEIVGLKRLVRPAGKPLLINFWATWCVPCREEYPDLVKIDEDYKGKIDFITISLDDATELDTSVPKFLSEMKAQMPAYLLKTNGNEEAAMAVVSKDWNGALPFTILFDAKGAVLYSRQGKVKVDLLRSALEKATATPTPSPGAQK
jgi:thiol-disulfide isomerase/thioredoxin